jgi:hypothetical protein
LIAERRRADYAMCFSFVAEREPIFLTWQRISARC